MKNMQEEIKKKMVGFLEVVFEGKFWKDGYEDESVIEEVQRVFFVNVDDFFKF